MSCDWDIACRTCITMPRPDWDRLHPRNFSTNFPDFNHMDQTMVALLLARKELEALGEAWWNVSQHPGTSLYQFEQGYLLNVAYFFAAHPLPNHELVPRNEYGQWIDEPECQR